MRAIDCKQLKPGMRIAKTIYDEVGRVLLNTGIVLNAYYIKRLNELELSFVYIEDEIVGPIEVADVIGERVKIQTAKALKNVVESACVHDNLDLRPVSLMVNQILDDLKGSPDLLVQLMDLRSANTFLYNHSIGVSVLSILTGIRLGLDDLKLKILGMGAILHDIGKSLSLGPDHTEHGFEILRKDKALSVMSAHVAYQHHENWDGTGYPRQLQGQEINLYASIVNLANFYDNLVNVQKEQQPLYPYQALEQVVALADIAFEPNVVKAFCKNIAPYPVGTAVCLNTGAVGIVMSVPLDYTTRPVVKIITDEKGMVLKDFFEVNLLRDTSLAVKEIITEHKRETITSDN